MSTPRGCPSCGASISETTALFCPHCGSRLETAPSSAPPTGVPAQSADSDEEVLGFFESGGLVKGLGAGYKLVVMRSKIVGKKEYLGTYSWFACLPGKLPAGKDREKAEREIQTSIEKKDLEILRDQVSGIEVKMPGLLSGGHLVFKTTNQGEVKIKVNSTAGGDLLLNLVKSLQEFAPDRVNVAKT